MVVVEHLSRTFLEEMLRVHDHSGSCYMPLRQQSRMPVLPSLERARLYFLTAVVPGTASDYIEKNVSWTRRSVCAARNFCYSRSRRHHRPSTRQHSSSTRQHSSVARHGTRGKKLQCCIVVLRMYISARSGLLLSGNRARSVATTCAHA